MKVFIRIMVLCFVFPMMSLGQQRVAKYIFYVGTYTQGQSEGIYQCAIKPGGKLTTPLLVARTDNPSFLTFTPDGKYLLAVNEKDTGMVSSFAVFSDTLWAVSRQFSGGRYPCHVSVNEKRYVLVSNYGSGTVGLLKVGQQGKLPRLLFTVQHKVPGLTAHAHESKFLGHSRVVISVDLGTNRLWFSKLDSVVPALVPYGQKNLLLPAGSGPRHFVYSRKTDKIYVVNELGNTVSIVMRNKSGRWVLGKTVSTLPPDFKGKSYCAEIELSNDGRFLYVSNRGLNSIAIFRVSAGGEELMLMDNVPVHGDYPRFFTLTPDERYLVVANQKSDNLVVFKRNRKTGGLQYLSETKISTPVCVLFR